MRLSRVAATLIISCLAYYIILLTSPWHIVGHTEVSNTHSASHSGSSNHLRSGISAIENETSDAIIEKIYAPTGAKWIQPVGTLKPGSSPSKISASQARKQRARLLASQVDSAEKRNKTPEDRGDNHGIRLAGSKNALSDQKNATKGTPGRRPPIGSCSCYLLEQPIFGAQYNRQMCVCNLVCFTGVDTAVQFGEACEPPSAVKGESITPISCNARERDAFLTIKRRMDQRTGYAFEMVNSTWLAERRERIVWRNGTSLVMKLNYEAWNIYHFMSKVIMLGYFNDALGSGFSEPIDRVFLNRDALMKHKNRGSWFRQQGKNGQHVTILKVLLERLFAKQGPLGEAGQKRQKKLYIHPKALLSFPTNAHLGGRLEFESHVKWANASDEAPVCLNRAVFTEALEGNLYQAGMDWAKKYIQLMQQSLRLPPPRRSPAAAPIPRLLYLERDNNGSRNFGEGAQARLKRVFESAALPLQVVNLWGMALGDQIEQIQWADIIVTIHGGNLLNPSLYMRPGAVLLEITPWHFLWPGYGHTCMAHGGIHMGWMLDPPAVLGPLDAEHMNSTFSDCFEFPACRSHWRQRSDLNVTARDARMIAGTLRIAKSITAGVLHMQGRQRGRDVRLRKSFMDRVVRGRCKEYDRDRHEPWLGYVDEQNKLRMCSLSVL